MRPEKYPFIFFATFIAWLSAISHTDAALLALDDFLINPPNTTEYTGVTNPSTGSPSTAWLAGQNGGTGFQGNWVTGGNQLVVDSDTTMSITGLSSPGGSVYSTFSSQLNSSRAFSSSVQSSLDSVNEIWFSSMITNDNAGGTNGLYLVADGGQIISTVQQLSRFGVNLGGGFTNSANGTFVPGTTYLMVGRLQIDRITGGNETISMWALTDIADFNISTPLLTLSGQDVITAANPGISGIQLQKNDFGARYDAIRIGTTANAVLGIPEPGTTSLLLVTIPAVALLTWRFRRHVRH